MSYVQRAVRAGASLSPRAQKLLSYWFGTEASWPMVETDALSLSEAECKEAYFATKEDRMKTWFAGGEQVDQEIKSNFQADIELLDSDKAAFASSILSENPRSNLAAVILADQLSRNIFRGTKKSFAFDSFAVEQASELVNSGRHKELRPLERAFLCMPFEHSEDLELHRLHRKVLEEAAEECKAEIGPDAASAQMMMMFAKYLDDHTKVVEQFGRYPHRNRVLGRETTAEEAEYLKNAETWGQ